MPGRDYMIDARFADHLPIDSCQALGVDLEPELPLDFQVGAGSKIQRDQLGNPLTHAPRDIVAGDDEVLALIVLAAKHDVRVRMTGVAMVDRDPVQPGPEIRLHLCHQAARQRLEIVIFGAILRRDDEPELMAIPLTASKEGLSVCTILVAAVELAWRAVPSNAIALDVAKVGPGRGKAPPAEADQPRLDDGTPRSKPYMPIPRTKQPGHGHTAADSASVKAPAADAP